MTRHEKLRLLLKDSNLLFTSPASTIEQDWLKAALSSQAEYLLPLYEVSNGIEGIIGCTGVSGALLPIRDFVFLDDNLLQIGYLDGGKLITIDTSTQFMKVGLADGTDATCLAGTFCSLSGFLEWLTASREIHRH